MASSQPSKNHRRNLRRNFAFAPVLAIAALMAAAAIWGPALSSAARNEPEKQNLRVPDPAAASQLEMARESRMMTPPAPFAAITVDRTDDNPAASACTAAASDCSLRGAVTFANLNPGTTINVPAGTYNLTISGAGEGFSGNNLIGDLDIRGNNTSVVGAGAATTIINQTISGSRVIEVNPNLDPNFIASISDVTISGGRETTGVGGGGIVSGSIGNVLTLTNCIFSGNAASGAGTFGGGGVSHSGGTLVVTGCTFNANTSTTSGGAIGYSAGDLLGRTPSIGTLTVTGSTFSANTANSTAAGGGAVDLFNFNSGSGSYSFTTSTFSANRAINGNGGGILVESGGPLTVATSAFTTNSARTSGGAISSSAPVASIQYSRLVGNTSTNASNGLTLFRRTGIFTGDDNWWGVNTGPVANDFRGFGGITITPATYLQLQASSSPSSVCTNGTSTINADIKKRNVGPDLTVELNGLPDFPATFIDTTPALGTVSGASANFVNGAASATFTAGATAGTASVDVKADNQTVTASITVQTNDTSDPANQSVCEGGTATFSTTATGPGPFTFVWKKGATVLNNGDLGGRVVIVSGGGSSTLTITGVQASDADTYTVEATGACSTATQTATLAVNQPTTATDPPDQTVCQGASAGFATTAGGTGPFSYAWTLDGSAFDGNNPSITVPTGSLSVGMHTVAVTVTGTCGDASQSATLTVQENTATTDPADQTVCQGATASFSTTASGTGPFSCAWTVDGSAFGGNTASISVATGSLSVGSHTVSVTTTGTCGSASQSATLTVQENTSTTDPTDQTVCQGANASFSTTASGTGPFSYAWTVDGSPFGGNTSSISVATGSLTVGNHTVSVTTTGTCGSASQSATLTVQENTSTTDPTDQTVCQGANATFSTTAGGTGPFSYAWTVDGSPFGGNTSTINVPTGSLSAGNHTVNVTTTGTCGSASQSATLTVDTAPTVTLNPVSQTASSGNVTFTAAASGSPAPTVQWQVSTNSGMSFSDIPGATSTSLTVTASPANNGYQYRAVFTNHCGTAITAAATLTTCNPPVITVGTGQLSMWPPNHKYETFNISDFNVTATSNCDGNITNNVVISQVTSDELDENPTGGDGNTTNDIVIAGDCKSVQLRAERDGNLDGRVYTITFKVTDARGVTTTATAKVIVPQNQGNGGAVDSGPHNTVNSNCP